MSIENPVGSEGKEPVASPEDKVSYETFKKLLDEKKSVQSKLMEMQASLDRFQAEREEAEQAKLVEQNRWKELYEAEANKRKKAEELAEGVRKAARDAKKKEAVLSTLGLKRDEFSRFVDFDAIPDTDDGFDLEAAKSYVEEFKKNYPELVKEVKQVPPTSTAPASSTSIKGYNIKDPNSIMEAFKASRRV